MSASATPTLHIDDHGTVHVDGKPARMWAFDAERGRLVEVPLGSDAGRAPMVHVVSAGSFCADDDAVWTLSTDPNREGWDTENGCPGFGLTRPVAEAYAAAINGTPALIAAYKGLGGLLNEAEAALVTARSKIADAPTDSEIEASAEAAWEECRAQIQADPAQGVEIGPWAAVPPHHAAKGRAETRAALTAFLARRRG